MVSGLILMVGAVLLATPSIAQDIEVLWTLPADMVMENAPVVVDLDGDGDAEIITAAYENIIAVDGTGEELWRFDARGRYMSCLAALERAGDLPLIFAADGTGQLTCLDGAGTVVWQAETGAVNCSSSTALADLNGDGRVQVLQGSSSGTLHVFDALTGDLAWKRTLVGECASPAIGDLNSDGRADIVIGTGAGKIFALDALGEPIWESTLGGTAPDWAMCAPILFGNSKGQTCVAAAMGEERVVCLDHEGQVLWERATRGGVASSLSAGDFDEDGRADLFVVTQLGVLYRFDEDGRVLWDIDTQGRSLASGAIIDIDGDGGLEYVLCTQRGNLLAFNGAGEIVFNHQLDHRTVNVTPAFGDIVRERPGLEFAVTGGESGRIICFGTSALIDAAAPWRTYRGDNMMSGAWFGLARSNDVRMVAENLDWDALFVGDDVTFRIVNPNPGDAPLTAEAACSRPDGSRQVAVGKIVGSHGLLKMPVSVGAPGVYQFEWTLTDDSRAPLATGSRQLTLQPYLNDQSLAQRAVLALQGAVGGTGVSDKDKGFKAAMYRESHGIETEAKALSSLQAAAPGASPAFTEALDKRTAALNGRARRGLALANVAPLILAHAPDSPIVAFEGVTWENRDVDRQLPSDVRIPLEIARRCVPGEHEPVSIKLLNVTLEPVVVRARTKSATDGPTATAHEVKPVPTNQNTTAWDPIVSLGDNKVTIPPLETREIWLDIDLSGVAPGGYTVEAMLEAGSSSMDVSVALDVLPFEMAGFDEMRVCLWGSYNDAAVKDLLAHGNTVFIMGLPGAKVGEGEAPQVTLDFTALDEFVARLEGHDVFLLMPGMPALGVAMEEEAYVPRLAAYLDQLFAHLAEKGIEEDHVALYPHDEPGGHGWDTVHHYIEFGRQGLKARPSLQFYVNGGGDLAMFEAFNEVAAVWCPGFYMLPEHTPIMEFLRGTGKRLWSYDCGYGFARPIGPNTKTINIVAQYRLAAVIGHVFGATGIGYWCYNIGDSMWDPVTFEYPVVYPNPDDTITVSRRWEAIREGIEDTRILIALRDKLTDAGVSAPAKAAIRNLLDGTVHSISKQAMDEVALGVARYMLDASNNDDTVDRLRAEMMECVALVAP
jgi:outer membrane protein assembly factor BamB